jgi:hypothetical protein
MKFQYITIAYVHNILLPQHQISDCTIKQIKVYRIPVHLILANSIIKTQYI